MRALSSLSTQKKTIHPRGRERRGKIRTTARQTLSLSLSPFSLSIIIIKANCAESICTEFTRRRTLFYRNARSGEEEEEEEEEDGEIQKLQNNNNNNKTHRIRTRSVKTRSPRLQPQPRAVVCCSDSTRFGLVAAFLFSLFFSRDDDDDDEKSDSLSLSLWTTTTTRRWRRARIALLRYFIPFLPSSSNHNNNLFRSARKTPSSSNGRVVCRVLSIQ